MQNLNVAFRQCDLRIAHSIGTATILRTICSIVSAKIELNEAQLDPCDELGVQLLVAAQHTHCEEDERADLHQDKEEFVDVHPVVDALLNDVHVLVHTR